MPSPFPGMDPYIETPEIWPDFHNDLASEIRAQLNARIQPRYVARLIPYTTYELIETGQSHSLRPDVGVWRTARETRAAYQSATFIEAAPYEIERPRVFPLTVYSVEVHRLDEQRLITSIEILSPVNKQPSHKACHDYQHKRRDLLLAEIHLLEIDLLRAGQRTISPETRPPAPYYMQLLRARSNKIELWPCQLQDRLPVLPVPLDEDDADAPLDLHAAAAAVYERGAYGVQIDYRRSPPPPLTESETAWLDAHLRQCGAR